MREGVADAMAFADSDDASSPSLLTWCFTTFHRFSAKAQEILQVLNLFSDFYRCIGVIALSKLKVHDALRVWDSYRRRRGEGGGGAFFA